MGAAIQPDRTFVRGALALTAALAFTAAASCSTVLGVDAHRYVGDAGVASVDRWNCLGAPDEESNPGSFVDVTLLAMDALQPSTAAGAIDGGSDLDTVSGTWLPGLSVRACALRDFACGDGSPSVTTTSLGAATFHLPENFLGFFEMNRNDLVPATLYPGNLLVGQPVASFPAYDISPAGLMELAASITTDSVGLDPAGTIGHVIVTIYDCQDHQAPGVSVSYSGAGPKTVPFYFNGGLPSNESPSVGATDGYGLAGAINVPTGSLTVTAELSPTNTPVGSTTVLVRPGSITFAWIRARTH